jgi:acyl carrier protein
MDKLGRTRLVGEVVEVFVKDVFGSVSSAPAAAAPAASFSAPASAAPAAPAQSNGVDRNYIVGVLKKVLSESTGFDESMLDETLNLEEDLGIDSIKRVEFVSNVSSIFNVTVSSDAMDKLGRTRLVGEVVEVFVKDVFGSASSGSPAPTGATPTQASCTSSSVDRNYIVGVLKKVLSESTGFDESMLDETLNLEEDLGIDSIKRVEFVSNVSSIFNVTVSSDAMDKLGRTRLVGEVVEVFVKDVFGSAGSANGSAPTGSNNGGDRERIIKVLKQVLSESTGFDESMLDESLNLEEDLGIDSIKRVEFVSNVSSVLNITVSSDAMDKLARTRLVGEVLEVFVNL